MLTSGSPPSRLWGLPCYNTVMNGRFSFRAIWSGPMRPATGLCVMVLLTILAILLSWSAESSTIGYWLAAQLVPVLYGLLAWRASRSSDAEADEHR